MVVNIALTVVSLLDLEEIPVTTVRPFAALLVWSNFLYYMKGFHITGPYVRTLWHTITDMVGFLIVFFTIQVGFAHALMLSEPITDLPRRTFREAFKETYLLGVIGEAESERYSEHVRYILLLGSTGTVSIVLLNMLIAIISETFDRLQEHSEASWVKGRAELIYELELVFGYQKAPPYVIFARVNKRHSDEASNCERLAHGRLSSIKRIVQYESSRMESAVTEVREQVHNLSATTNLQLQRLDQRLEVLCNTFALDPRHSPRSLPEMPKVKMRL